MKIGLVIFNNKICKKYKFSNNKKDSNINIKLNEYILNLNIYVLLF